MDSIRQTWSRYLPIALAVVLMILLAMVQGRWSDRWNESGEDAQQLAALLERVPLKIGPWEGTDQEASETELDAAGAVGHVTRVYRNVDTGETVSLFIICGHMRDVSVHTPDRCYPRAGFSQLGAPARMTLAVEPPADFFTTKFRKSAPEGIQDVRVFWTWGHESEWKVADNPRLTFRGVRALYKMYLINPAPQTDDDLQDSPCVRFGEALLPELTRTLFSKQKAGNGEGDHDREEQATEESSALRTNKCFTAELRQG